jgi:DNA-binding transcriptional regulator GbsR (MarR family)
VAELEKKIKALDGHAWDLVGLLSKKEGCYTTNGLVQMLGMSKTAVINVMKLAEELDPEHTKMTKGKRRKLYLECVT